MVGTNHGANHGANLKVGTLVGMSRTYSLLTYCTYITSLASHQRNGQHPTLAFGWKQYQVLRTLIFANQASIPPTAHVPTRKF